MKKIKRFLKWLGICLLVIVLAVTNSGYVLYNKTYQAPYPAIRASKDSTIIAHGKHLVYSTAHCIECHYQPKDSLAVSLGHEVPLAGGGFPFIFPGGKFYSANISSDPETGIGKFTDGEIARSMRYMVKHDDKVLIPAMEFQHMSDDDITAIISYLRTTPSIKYTVPENDYNLLGKIILAFFIRPDSSLEIPPKNVIADTTVEYGRYIATALCNCRGCHTLRDMNTAKYIGEELAGGIVDKVVGNPKLTLVAPNLTPDPETGRMAEWTFETFKARFQQGKLIKESVMPWGQFKHLDDIELRAIWKYLHSVKPVKNDPGPALQPTKS